MRRLLVSAVLLAGCGGRAPTQPPSPDEEKAAEQQLKEEAQRELKGKSKVAKHNPDDD